jgi:hypothetical protein
MDEVERARQRYSARYRLTIPSQQSASWTPDALQESTRRTAEHDQESTRWTAECGQESISRTAEPSAEQTPSSPPRDTSSPSPDASSPSRGPDISNGLLQQRTPTGGHAAPRTPLRPPAPSGLGTEQVLSPPVGGHDQNQLTSNQLPARADKTPPSRSDGRPAASRVDNPATTDPGDPPSGGRPFAAPARASPASPTDHANGHVTRQRRRKPRRRPT